MEDRELVTLIEQEVNQSIGHFDGELAYERKLELDYYNGKPFGNEVEGESQVISTDVADTVEGMLPSILEIFTASDDVVRFDANGPEDEAGASQQTETANYVFYRQNNGFLILYEWFKDALIQKNGVVRYWWDEKKATSKEQYRGLTEGEYLGLVQTDGAEELEHSAYDDPQALTQKESMRQHVLSQVGPEAEPILAQFDSIPIPQLHDASFRFTKDVSQVRIRTVPPEEFGISAKHHCVSIQETPFCYQRTRKSVSTLREEGCPETILEQLGSNDQPDFTPETIARDRFLDLAWRDTQSGDKTTSLVWVTDGFIRIDWDGDGIAELRHFILVGQELWINEEADHINFAALTPIIMPHRWIGRSAAELVMDIQLTKSVIWRQMLNNLYLTNNPRKAVLSTAGGIVQANLDDLLTSRPGGVMREYVPNAIRNEEIPFVAGASFPMLEYMDGVKENRTGVTRYNQGTDADSLNKTARGINQIMQAGHKRLSLIARIFAETGVKDLMRGIVYMLSHYSTKAMTVKLRNQWVDVDPREWKTQFNMTINVGLGTGNRDTQLAHLMAVDQSQIELMKTGRAYMVSDENIYNLYKKRSEAMGFKHPELFISDPQKITPQAKQQPPNPDVVKIQAETSIDQAKLKFGQWKEQFTGDLLKSVEQIKAQVQLQIAAMDNASKKEIEQMKISADAQMGVFKQSGQSSNEAAQLDLKKIELGYAEQMLGLKKQFDTFVQQQQQALLTDSDAKTAERERSTMEITSSSMKQVAKEVAGVAALLKAMQRILGDQMLVQQQTLEAIQKPKSVSIGNVQKDSSGQIVGATVTPSTSRTIQ